MDQGNKKNPESPSEAVLYCLNLPSYHIPLFYGMDTYQHLQEGWICSYVQEKQNQMWRH